MKRKTGKDYAKELSTIKNMFTKLENEVKDRALFLMKKFPDVKLPYNEKDYTNMNTYNYIDVICTIEMENRKNENIIQTKIQNF